MQTQRFPHNLTIRSHKILGLLALMALSFRADAQQDAATPEIEAPQSLTCSLSTATDGHGGASSYTSTLVLTPQVSSYDKNLVHTVQDTSPNALIPEAQVTKYTAKKAVKIGSAYFLSAKTYEGENDKSITLVLSYEKNIDGTLQWFATIIRSNPSWGDSLIVHSCKQ